MLMKMTEIKLIWFEQHLKRFSKPSREAFLAFVEKHDAQENNEQSKNTDSNKNPQDKSL